MIWREKGVHYKLCEQCGNPFPKKTRYQKHCMVCKLNNKKGKLTGKILKGGGYAMFHISKKQKGELTLEQEEAMFSVYNKPIYDFCIKCIGCGKWFGSDTDHQVFCSRCTHRVISKKEARRLVFKNDCVVEVIKL